VKEMASVEENKKKRLDLAIQAAKKTNERGSKYIESA
jgi:hypothetical protein